MASLAEKVARLRAERGWTLKELSERSGITVSHLNAIEKGRRQSPSFQCIDRLSAAFGVSLSYFSEQSKPEMAEDPSLREVRPEPDGGNPWARVAALYDPETFQFIASEQSRPYVTFAKQLAEAVPEEDPSSLMQLIAQFIRDQRAQYEPGAVSDRDRPTPPTDADRHRD